MVTVTGLLRLLVGQAAARELRADCDSASYSDRRPGHNFRVLGFPISGSTTEILKGLGLGINKAFEKRRFA